MSNVTPIRPSKAPYGLDQLSTEGGPLARLMRGLGMDDKLPPIETPKRVDVAPDTVGVPVSASTPYECICQTCRIFEKEPHAPMCPKCTLRSANRQRRSDDRRAHYDAVERELSVRDAMVQRAETQVRRDANLIQAYSDRQALMKHLDEIDPDWRTKFACEDTAEIFYQNELYR